MNMKLLFPRMMIMALVFFSVIDLSGQPGFKGGLVLGLNASQIDGDFHAGYDKLGLSGGLQTSITLKERSRLALEFLYSGRGSQSAIISGVAQPVQRIHLDYIEIPLIYQYNDWLIDELYYKVRAELGVSYGFLTRVNIKNSSPLYNNGDNFNKQDLSILFGAGYMFNKNWGVNIRYTRSLTRLYRFEVPNEPIYRNLIGYFLSFRAEYYF